MQEQRTKQLAITAKQSLQLVQTLLRVSFGCVAYLRDLLPEDNFIDAYLTSLGSDSLSQPAEASAGGGEQSRDGGHLPPSRALKVKTIKKKFSTEGDRLIQYLEEGIFDALEKQYLRSFIFAVYMDDDDPDNIIEAYTFNFSYHVVPGSMTKVPVMTLGERLENLSLDPRATASKRDPATAALMQGRSPTLGDVKKSVKNLIKALMVSVQVLHALPRRRFGAFKLFYMDHVPDDYEPPHFSPGDAEKKYFFTTHTRSEVPEKISIGTLSTPYHGVELHVASISETVPHDNRRSEDDTCFGNLVNHDTGHSPAAQQNISLEEREKLIDLQRRDASMRRVVWDAEMFANAECEDDAEGEDDPDYRGRQGVPSSQQPRGIRNPDGTVVEMNEAGEGMSAFGFAGSKMDGAEGIKETVENDKRIQEEGMSPTQVVDQTQGIPCGARFVKLLLGTGDAHLFAKDEGESMTTRGIETQLVQDILEQSDPICSNSVVDTEMLDLETQLPATQPDYEDAITSYPSPSPIDRIRETPFSEDTSVPQEIDNGNDSIDTDDVNLDCDCGILEEEDGGICQCEGPCGRWLHIWCMGYHSVDDPRLPPVFQCFTCRLRNDPGIDLLDSRNLTSEYISKFKDLSFFRRALKIIEIHQPENVTRFKELLGSEVSMAGQAWKRLEAEGFIAIETTETDGIGFLEVHNMTTRKSKTKKKQRQQTKQNLKRAKYVRVPEAMKGKAFQDYFDPMKEASILKIRKPRLIDDNNPSRKGSRHDEAALGRRPAEEAPGGNESQAVTVVQAVVLVEESQTQPETQLSAQDQGQQQLQPSPPLLKKRKCADETQKDLKRIKISVGRGVNLEDY